MTAVKNLPIAGGGIGPLHLLSDAEGGGVHPAPSAAASASLSSSSRRRSFVTPSPPQPCGASTSEDPSGTSAGADADADADTTASDRTRARAEALITSALYQQHVENDLDRALALHGSALELYRSSASTETADGPASPRRRQGGEYDIEIAVTLTDIGDVHRRREEAREAMGSYREALAIFRTIFNRRSESQRKMEGFSENHPGVQAAVRGIRLLGGEVALISM